MSHDSKMRKIPTYYTRNNTWSHVETKCLMLLQLNKCINNTLGQLEQEFKMVGPKTMERVQIQIH